MDKTNNHNNNEYHHISVLLNESIEALNISPEKNYVDCTLGGAGHSLEIAKLLSFGKLIAIDKDSVAIANAKQKLKEYEDNVILVKSDFKKIKSILADLGVNKVDGILADLGVSSHQIDTAERGFSYMKNGALDMRMDKEAELTAEYIVNNYSEKDLADIIYLYGEETFSRKIAKSIIDTRKTKHISTTTELAEIVYNAIPRKFHGKGNVSKKTFQAIRIEVNSELSGLDDAIMDMISSLEIGGRLAIITFHSLEDRIVKNVFKKESTDCICDKSNPICICNHKKSIKLVYKKPILPSEIELRNNKRSASAKLRVVERV